MIIPIALPDFGEVTEGRWGPIFLNGNEKQSGFQYIFLRVLTLFELDVNYTPSSAAILRFI
jgi:hypothetical protein